VRKQPSQEAVAARAVLIRSLNDAKTQVIDLARRNRSQSDDIDQLVDVLVREWHYHTLRADELRVELDRRGV
jgi:uncharacterized membrane protein YjjP (DUF1212 family)